METRGSSIGANDLTRASHHTPVTRRDSIQLAGLIPPGPVTRSHGTRRKKDHASFTSCTPFERGQFAQSAIDIGALLFGSFYVLLWITVILGLIPFALFCLLLVSFH